MIRHKALTLCLLVIWPLVGSTPTPATTAAAATATCATNGNGNSNNNNNNNAFGIKRSGSMMTPTTPILQLRGGELHHPESLEEMDAIVSTIPKPDGSLRSLADLRELNKRIKCKPYPLPKISDLLQKLEGFNWATSLDLNMGYYNSPDIFQEKMNDLMQDLEFARAYIIDDLLIKETLMYI